ncbi:putative nuclease HARBI1 [Temnothorax nylanderi]|uniref:putative nuclease HARBI1 n=1 Tax=Temnothorax nylanderi TaxID=102681 RepID=UPI003A89B922
MDMINISEIEDINLSSEDEEVQIRVPKRYIRDGENPFEFYNESEFKKRFRFAKNSIMFGILPLIEERLSKINNRGLPITPVFQLLISLRFYATASFQLVMGDVIKVSQPTISRIIFRVSTLLASHINVYIKMPLSAVKRIENKRLFEELGRVGAIGLPSISGAIDCTHIRLTHTRFQAIDEIFRNRKGYFSLNVQAVVGPHTEFLDIVPEWPGSEHDSRIFQNSRIYMRYRQRELDGMLVGDGGYPSLPFLLTPINNPISDEKESYNIIHGKTRRIVERVFGIWKRRFPCLSRGLQTKLITSTTIVIACAVLHNLSLIYNDIMEVEEEEVENINQDDEVPPLPPHWQPGDGFLVRNAIIERMFRLNV